MRFKLLILGSVLAANLAFAGSVRTEEVRAVAADSPTLLGVLKYEGGFADKTSLKLSIPTIVKYFRVAIPAFCKDVEILEASTKTEGLLDSAQLIENSERIYAVNKGAGQRISEVVLTLNGPTGIGCTIPIYSQDKPESEETTLGNMPTLPTGNFQFCNRSTYALWATIGYHNGQEWVAEGWWKLKPGECRFPKTVSKLSGNIYLYAFDTAGKQWGNDSKFCINKQKNFRATDDNCYSKQAGYDWEILNKHSLSGLSQLIVQFTP